MSTITQTLIALFALAVSSATVSPAAAHYSQRCWVSTGEGLYYSDWHRFYSEARPLVFATICNYASGKELNARAGFRAFAHDRIYVVILWPRSAPSYIRLIESVSFCGEIADRDCAETIAGLLTGYEDYGLDRYGRPLRRTWGICQPGFIDSNCYKMVGGWRD